MEELIEIINEQQKLIDILISNMHRRTLQWHDEDKVVDARAKIFEKLKKCS